MSERATAQIEIDYLRDEVVKLKEKLKDVAKARELLKENGYFVDNLWCTADVTENYHCSKEKAQQVLNMALTNTATVEQIWYAIDDACDTLEIKSNQNQD